MMVTALVVAAVCLVLEAFFSSAEIALVSADRAHIRQRAQAGHRGARYVEEFLAAPHKLLATTLLGTQLSLVVSTTVVTLWLYSVAPHRAELYLLLGLTPIIVTFAEIVPKAIVRQRANTLAPLMAYVLHAVVRIFSPLVSLLARTAQLLSRRMGVEVHRKLVTREELEMMVAARRSADEPSAAPQSAVTGAPVDAAPRSDVTEGERSMISRIFEMSSLEVYDIMVPLSDVTALPETAKLTDIAREIKDKKYSRIPVYRDRLDQIVGVVHAFEVLKASDRSSTAAELLRPPIYVPESHKAIELLARLQKSHQGMAVVVDEYGGAVGVVTVEDILERIVGDIEDEYDVEPQAIRREADGSYRVPARMRISQLNKELGLSLPESEDYETVAGLLLDQLKHIPKIGESLLLGGATLTVATASDRRIEEVVLRTGKRR